MKLIGAQLIVISLLAGIGYFYASANPLKLYGGRTIQEWKKIGDKVYTVAPGRIEVVEINARSGYEETAVYYLHEEFNVSILKDIFIYGICADLLLLGSYLAVYKKKRAKKTSIPVGV